MLRTLNKNQSRLLHFFSSITFLIKAHNLRLCKFMYINLQNMINIFFLQGEKIIYTKITNLKYNSWQMIILQCETRGNEKNNLDEENHAASLVILKGKRLK